MCEDCSSMRKRFPALCIMIDKEKVALECSRRRLARAMGRFRALLHSCKTDLFEYGSALEFRHFGIMDDSRTA